MLESTYDRTKSITTEVLSLQAGIAKKSIRVSNVCTWGFFNPQLSVCERLWDLYETSTRSAVNTWLNALPVKAEPIEQIVVDVREEPQPEQKKPLEPKEQEIMNRQRPDYSNLRAAAEGNQRQSIMDNDELWDGMQATNTKSPYRQRVVKERNWVDYTRNNETA